MPSSSPVRSAGLARVGQDRAMGGHVLALADAGFAGYRRLDGSLRAEDGGLSSLDPLHLKTNLLDLFDLRLCQIFGGFVNRRLL